MRNTRDMFDVDERAAQFAADTRRRCGFDGMQRECGARAQRIRDMLLPRARCALFYVAAVLRERMPVLLRRCADARKRAAALPPLRIRRTTPHAMFTPQRPI
jgi:hypothetical protein